MKSVLIRILALAGILMTAVHSFGQCEDPNITGLERHAGDRFALVIRLTHLTEATVTVTLKMHNMRADGDSPYTMELTGPGDHVILTLVPIDRLAPSSFEWTWKYCIGHETGADAKPFVYQYPFKTGTLLQGPGGSFTHQAGGPNAEAYDWAMPVGTPVYAARSGVVIATRDDSDVGGVDPKYTLAANYVVIRHDDGTYAEYEHLKKHGVLVKVGDHVTVGDGIALSGATGRTSQPHLHFAVYYAIDGASRKTLPLTFADTARGNGQFR